MNTIIFQPSFWLWYMINELIITFHIIKHDLWHLFQLLLVNLPTVVSLVGEITRSNFEKVTYWERPPPYPEQINTYNYKNKILLVVPIIY